jgi:hypothetical protein
MQSNFAPYIGYCAPVQCTGVSKPMMQSIRYLLQSLKAKGQQAGRPSTKALYLIGKLLWHEKPSKTLYLRPHKKGQWALHVYRIANFVVSWFKWLQMIWNNSKWISICQINQLKPFEFIYNNLESFRGDKISYTINMQRSLSFFCSDS